MPALEVGLLQVGGERVQDPDAARDVQVDLFGDLARHVLVTQHHRLTGPRTERDDRHGAVREQRQNSRRRHQQREARRDSLH
jgi:hypothetical protein